MGEFSNGAGLAAYLLSLNAIMTLEKKGIFTTVEINEFVEHALLTLETFQLSAPADERSGFEVARTLLEQFRRHLSETYNDPG